MRGSNGLLAAIAVMDLLIVSCTAPIPSPVPPIIVPSAVPAVPASNTATRTAVPEATREPTRPAPTPSLTPTVEKVTPTFTAVSTAPPSTATPVTGFTRKINFDAFAPPGPARELFLNNCANCHSFICSVRGQRTQDSWLLVKRNHRDKVSGLSDDEFDEIFAYLMENFNNNKPEPELPADLLAGLHCEPL